MLNWAGWDVELDGGMIGVTVYTKGQVGTDWSV